MRSRAAPGLPHSSWSPGMRSGALTTALLLRWPLQVFREVSSDQVQVVYKRESGGYGILIPHKP
jgi:hypothetical protein